jgi:hypothetical protein
VTARRDPNHQALPNLHAMGADPNTKDLFAEIGYLHLRRARPTAESRSRRITPAVV